MARVPAEEINFLCIINRCSWLLFGLGTAHARINSYTLSFVAKSSMTFYFLFFVFSNQAKSVREKNNNSDLVLLSLETALDQQLTLAKFFCKNTP